MEDFISNADTIDGINVFLGTARYISNKTNHHFCNFRLNLKPNNLHFINQRSTGAGGTNRLFVHGPVVDKVTLAQRQLTLFTALPEKVGNYILFKWHYVKAKFDTFVMELLVWSV